LGDYEKGSVPFDGVTRKAIVEVIPKYLAMILNQLKTGGKASEELIFDYNTGMLRQRGEIIKEYNKTRSGNVQDSAAGSQMKDSLMARRSFETAKHEEEYSETINRMMSMMAMQSGNFKGDIKGARTEQEKIIAAEIKRQWKKMGSSERFDLDKARMGSRSISEQGMGALTGHGHEGSSIRQALSSSRMGATAAEAELERKIDKLRREQVKLANTRKGEFGFGGHSKTKPILEDGSEISRTALMDQVTRLEWELDSLQRSRSIAHVHEDDEVGNTGSILGKGGSKGKGGRTKKSGSMDGITLNRGTSVYDSEEGAAEIDRAAKRALEPLFDKIVKSLSPSNLMNIIRHPIQSMSVGMDKLSDKLGEWVYGARDGGVTNADKKIGILGRIRDSVNNAFMGKDGSGVSDGSGKGGGMLGWFKFQFGRFTGFLKQGWDKFALKMDIVWNGKDGKSGVAGFARTQWKSVTKGLFGEGGFFGKGGALDKEILGPLKSKVFDPIYEKVSRAFSPDGPLFGKEGIFGSEGKLFGKQGVMRGAYSKLFGEGTGIFTRDGGARGLGKGAFAMKGAISGAALFGPIGAIAGATIGTFAGEEVFKPGGLFDRGKAKVAAAFRKSIICVMEKSAVGQKVELLQPVPVLDI
jgi:hypothetical protein